MLAKKHRLVKRQEYEKIWEEGKSFYCEGIIGFKVLKNNLNISRFGFIVGAKVSKKAVLRNRIKRQLSEIIREKIGKIEKGYDVIVIALPGILGKSYQEIDKNVSKGLKKLKLL